MGLSCLGKQEDDRVQAKRILAQELKRTREALGRVTAYATFFELEADIEELVSDINTLEDRLAKAA